uniref:tRNA carboxymethyluridine synthase n=1 Tax=viral metagenome TaxID=1070528 RepID=A0A6C0D8V2_9ZZZZ
MSNDIENIVSEKFKSNIDQDELTEFVEELIITPDEKIDSTMRKLKRQYQMNPSKQEIHKIFREKFSSRKISPKMRKYMIKKQVRSNSGVLVVTIVLAPNKFSCKYDCAYCPQETDLEGNPTQPRSYLSNEPAMLRALESNFDVKGQFNSRIGAYKATGNISETSSKIGSISETSSKIEVIFSGGTWESYPLEYREQVIRELYWAANSVEVERESKTLEEEITINETSTYRIIGFTLETRPDNIRPETIQQYRRWGVTRIQIGVQHYDDAILKKVNRKCYTKHTIEAIRLLKQAGFKVVVHLMPDLPGSSPEQDKWMFEQAITNPDLQFDDIKIYPTAVVQTFDDKHIVKSKILDLYNSGEFKPYSEKNIQDLIDVCLYYKTNMNPWVRIQRLVRDIPTQDIAAGYNGISNLRQVIHTQMKKKGLKCNCIRCNEIGDLEHDNHKPILAVRRYTASQGTEYHISIEAHTMDTYQKLIYYLILAWNFIRLFVSQKHSYWNGDLASYIGLYGFLRMRFDPAPGGKEDEIFIPELQGCALIREVHVYGTSMGVGVEGSGSQHKGHGKWLMATAEQIALDAGYKKVAVIAGVGTREYYKNKCGYHLEGTYMVKYI